MPTDAAEQRAELERRAEAVLAKTFGGIHNVRHWDKRDANDIFVAVTLDYGRDLATWDGNTLTALVVHAHDECVRLSIRHAGARRFGLMFHPRTREGRIGQRHPTMEQAIATMRGTSLPSLLSHEYVYLGRASCGCVVASVVDRPDHRDETAASVATMIREGCTLERVHADDARNRTDHCTHDAVEG